MLKKKFSRIIVCFSIMLFVFCITGIAFATSGNVNPESATKTAEKENEIPQPIQKEGGVISMSFAEAPVGYVLQSLGRLYGANFTISQQASGIMLNIELAKVTFDDALEMIAFGTGISIEKIRPKFYVVRMKNEIENTATLTEQEKNIRNMEKRFKDGILESVSIRYTTVQDVTKALSALVGADDNPLVSIASLGTGGGDISGREYNTIALYAADKDIMERVKKLIKELDVPRPMVEVEALFLEVSNNKNQNVGITWDILTEPLEFLEKGTVFNGNKLNPIIRGNAWKSEVMIQASRGDSKARVLASPKVRVMSGKVATFWSETQIPILNENKDGEVSTEYKNVGVKIDILPVVLDDNTITLNVRPRSSSVSGTVTLKNVEAPQITEQSAETSLLIKPDDIMVIGGLLSNRDVKSSTKFPILHKLPLIGELFKSDTTRKEESSLSVYLRLKLISDFMTPAELSARGAGEARVHYGTSAMDKEIQRTETSESSSRTISESVQTTPYNPQNVTVVGVQSGLSSNSLKTLEQWRAELGMGTSDSIIIYEEPTPASVKEVKPIPKQPSQQQPKQQIQAKESEKTQESSEPPLY